MERSYSHFDKSTWGPGPWQDEPDKIQWVDEPTGLDCLIVRNSLGALCGYVGVPNEHPWHGRPYGGDGWEDDTAPDQRVDVHGGLTYSDSCDEAAQEDRGICHVPLAGRPADVWWFGFDCAHGCDVVPGMEARDRERGWAPIRQPYSSYRDVRYVRHACSTLAAQIATVAP